IVLIIAYYVTSKRKNERIKRNIEEIQILMEQLSGMGSENEFLKTTLSSQSERLSHFRQDLLNLFQDQPKILNKLCDQYFDKSNTDAERLMIVDRIEKHIEKFKSDQNMLQIEESVDKYMNGIIGKLRNQDGLKISERDLRIISLCCAGFSAKAICLFLNIKIKNFYNIKYRLADRISAVGKNEYADVLKCLKNS
ncbi:MAG: hypothetical protein K2M93_05380, partial [Muribaculaceae bacterium]|nr:hypothetical protein [Muribaculaceae bacterium]